MSHLPENLVRAFGAAVLTCGCSAAAHAQWTHLAHDAGRSAAVRSVIPSLAMPAWVCSADESGNPITFIAQASPVATLDAVYALGSVPGSGGDEFRVFAIARRTGLALWSAPAAEPAFDSISSPAIDTVNQTIIVASGAQVSARRFADGSPAWQTSLSRIVVNASPLVVEHPIRGRVFITDFGSNAKLYCINASPFDAAANPFAPGQIVWSVPIAAASGATPTLVPDATGGRIIVATYGVGSGAGRVLCYPSAAITAPSPLWQTVNPAPLGFFGGLAAFAETSNRTTLYTASYAFSGGQFSANLLKLDAMTGSILWSIAANRSDSIPCITHEATVLLAGGVDGFGTTRGLTRYADNLTSVEAVWDTATSVSVGGRLVQPVVIESPAGLRVLCAAAPTPDDQGFGTDIYVIDPAQTPGDSAFIVGSFAAAGGSAIVCNGNIYAVGAAGLFAFGPAPARADLNMDSRADIDDLHAWEQASGDRDVDQDGIVNEGDRARLLAELRAFERLDLKGGRP